TELLGNVGVPVDSTLWLELLRNVHVTVPPTAMVSTAGLIVPLRTLKNWKLLTLTAAVVANAAWPLTVSCAESARVPAETMMNVMPLPVALATVAAPVAGETLA